MTDDISFNVRNMARGAANYNNYLELTNCTAVFYVNTILIGAMGYFTKV